MQVTVNTTAFAFRVSIVGSALRKAATPIHMAYTNADSVGKKQLKAEWMIGHIAAHLSGSNDMREEAMVAAMTDKVLKDAERIFSLGKGAGAKPANVAAIDRAYSDFRYHVVRAVKVVKETEEVKLSKEEKAAFAAFVEACGDINRAAVVFKAMSAVVRAAAK